MIRHIRLIGGLAVVGLLLVAFCGVAAAAKGAKPPHSGHTSPGTSSITLVVLNSADGIPHYGGWVAFNVATTATTQPWVNLQCSQNGVVVSQMWNGLFAGSLTGQNFGLYSPQWTSGAADCTAYLTTPQWTVLASTSFHVDA